jgi:hypothetical protein
MVADVLKLVVDATSIVALGRATLFEPLATVVDCSAHEVKLE